MLPNEPLSLPAVAAAELILSETYGDFQSSGAFLTILTM
jgi:hypothetical protein